MMPGKSQTPALRFTGFTGDWVERKLGGLTDITTGALDANAMTPDGEYDFYTCSLQVYKIDQYAFEGPAITIAGNGYVGCLHLADGRFNAYQRTYVLSNFKASREFLYEEIGRELPAKVTREARNGNIPYIVRNMLTELEISLPCSTEQSTIGRFFRKVDSLITQQQKKVEKLQGIKKGLMKKMFPRGGRTLPEVRFAGFDGEWVERKIGSEIVTLPFRDFLATPDMKGLHPIIQQGDSPIMGYSGKEPFEDFQKVVLFGDHTLSLYRPHEPFLIATDGIRIIHVKEKDADFFYYYLERYKPVSEGYKRYFSILIDREGKRPGAKSEQSSIGRLFRKLDTLITLHGQKLEKLRHVKQALLGRMFV